MARFCIKLEHSRIVIQNLCLLCYYENAHMPKIFPSVLGTLFLYIGVTCADELVACDPNPCHNNGVCNEDELGVFCICPAPYEGLLCQLEISEYKHSAPPKADFL